MINPVKTCNNRKIKVLNVPIAIVQSIEFVVKTKTELVKLVKIHVFLSLYNLL
jgi:hypothetical protein